MKKVIIRSPKQPKNHLNKPGDLLLIRLALIRISGIITTFLGKTATNSKDTGREIRVHHSKSLPLLLNGERLFFSLNIHRFNSYKPYNNQMDMISSPYSIIMNSCIVSWFRFSDPRFTVGQG